MIVKRVKKTTDDWQKCCRWCHNYSNGQCMNNQNLGLEESNTVYQIAEQGLLDATLTETLEGIKLTEFKELEYLLRDYNLSEKRIKEFNSLFIKCWESFRDETLKPELDTNISSCYQINMFNLTQGTNNLEIVDPENFCCDKWS